MTGMAAADSVAGSHDDPQSLRWAGLDWSPWQDLNAAHQKKRTDCTGTARLRQDIQANIPLALVQEQESVAMSRSDATARAAQRR
jgi:hypothetical protein